VERIEEARVSAAIGYILRRLGWAAIVVAGVTTLSFLVAYVLPGDPARMLVGAQASASEVARARELYGLDQPVLTQYGRFVSRLLHAGPIDKKRDVEHKSCAAIGIGLHIDLGYSFSYHRPVVDLLKSKVPRSAELALAAILLQTILGVTIGAFAASRRGTRWDEATIGVTLIGVSAPTFLLGLLLQYVLAYKLRILPYDGYGDTPAEQLRSLVLPALTLGIFGSALYARITRDELSVLLAQDFVRTARAKGASGARVLVVHALRNALVPLTTLVVLELGALIGGAVITETLFRWPGVGQMAVTALLNRDGPVIVGTVLFTSMVVVVSTFALDLLYVALDPKIRAGQASSAR
jgi:peptide/nickel transport system permease protein